MADLIVNSKVKDKVKSLDIRMSGELPDALDEKVAQMLEDGAARAKANKRGTLQPHDL